MQGDPTLAATLAEELTQAFDSELDQVQATALQYYDGEPGSVPAGWSDLVSCDVRDAVESTVSELMASINTDEPLAIFDPEIPGDEERAELETHAVHQAIFGHNRGAVLLEESIRDALLQRYGIVKVYVNTQTKRNTQQFENLPPEALAHLMMGDTENHTTQVGELSQNDDGTVNASVTITDTISRLELSSVAPENFRWSADLTSPFLDGARFFAERCYYTRAQLADMGARGSQDVPMGQAADAAQAARYPDNPGNVTAARDADTSIECWWCYLRNNTRGGYDQHLFVMPSSVMLTSWVEHHPFACGVTCLRPHRFDGVSLFDRIGPIQKTKTYLLRQLATNARLANQMRMVARDRQVNPDDIASTALNPVVRVTGIPSECLMPLPVQDVTSQVLATMQWIDGLRRESGGASIDMTSPELQVAGQTAHAAEREYSFREMGTTSMLRTIGATLVRSLYLLVHATIKGEISDPMVVRRGAKFENADPQHWPDRTRVSVDIGQPLGARGRRIAALQQTVMAQTQALMQGGAGLLVTIRDVYRAQVDMGKLAGLPDASRYWTDPDSPQAQQAAQQQQRSAQQQAAAQAAQQQQIIDSTKEIERLKSDTNILKQRLANAGALATTRVSVQERYFADIIDANTAGVEIDAKQASEASANGEDRGRGSPESLN